MAQNITINGIKLQGWFDDIKPTQEVEAFNSEIGADENTIRTFNPQSNKWTVTGSVETGSNAFKYFKKLENNKRDINSSAIETMIIIKTDNLQTTETYSIGFLAKLEASILASKEGAVGVQVYPFTLKFTGGRIIS